MTTKNQEFISELIKSKISGESLCVLFKYKQGIFHHKYSENKPYMNRFTNKDPLRDYLINNNYSEALELYDNILYVYETTKIKYEEEEKKKEKLRQERIKKYGNRPIFGDIEDEDLTIFLEND